MQIRNGKIHVTQGQNIVYGTGVDWSGVDEGDLFVTLGGHNGIYWVNSINTAVSPAQITLNTPYTGPTISSGAATAGNYAIHQDFTPNKKLPLLNAGDIETAAVYSRAMQILDQGLASVESGGAGSSGGISIEQTAHGFVAGSAIYHNGTIYTLCFGDSISTAIPDGIVSEVIDANNFKLVTSGQFTSSYEFTSGSGKYFGPGDQANVDPDASNLVASDSAQATVFVPVVKAIGSSPGAGTFVGLVTNIGGSQTGTFSGSGSPGIVPDPASGYTGSRFLREDGTWQSLSLGAGTVNYDTLKLGIAENLDHSDPSWDENFWDAWINDTHEDDNEKSIYWALMNLYHRMVDQEARGSIVRHVTLSGDFVSQTFGYKIVQWEVPSLITKIKVDAYSGAHLVTNDNVQYGFFVSSIITVTPSEILTFHLPNLPVIFSGSGSPLFGGNNRFTTTVAQPHLEVLRGSVSLLKVPGVPSGEGRDSSFKAYQDNLTSPVFHGVSTEEVTTIEHAPIPLNWGGSIATYAPVRGSGARGARPIIIEERSASAGMVRIEYIGN